MEFGLKPVVSYHGIKRLHMNWHTQQQKAKQNKVFAIGLSVQQVSIVIH